MKFCKTIVTFCLFLLLFSFSSFKALAQAPTKGPADPTCDASEVVSLCSEVYTNVPVSTFLTVWSAATLTDVTIDGNAMKLYENVDFLGIETPGPTFQDITSMTDLHLDIWTPNMTTFRVKLVDFGPDCAFGGGDDTEHEIAMTPTLNAWMSVDIPIADFIAGGLTATPNKLAQIILSGQPAGSGTVYVDNLLFSGSCDPVMAGAPTTGPADPTCDASEVVSLCSEVYTNVPVSTFLTVWSAATLTDVTIDGNAMKLYENVDFLGIETPGPTFQDITSMTDLHLDIWTPNMTTFRVKLVDFGPDCAFGGGDDTEHEIAMTPTLNAWMSVDIPIADFIAGGLTATPNKLAQIILSGQPAGGGTVYVDNLLFSGDCNNSVMINAPGVAAPPPNCDPSDVLSLCSSEYPQVAVSTFLTSWSSASLTNVQVAGTDIKLYEDVDFLGIETPGPTYLDISSTTDLHLDIWTPNMTTFRVKLVDFGPDCAFGGGDDTEHEIAITPTLNAWMSVDIPIADFIAGGLTTTPNKIAQIILSGQPAGAGTVYVDNLMFSNDCNNVLNPLPICPELVWSDEFDGSALDLTKWTPQLGDGCPSLCGWGNNELQYYQAQNAVVSGGTLEIIAKEESVAGYDYTSARLRTINLGDWTYGRFEASIKLPEGQGIWPAFWMLSTNEVYGTWPQSGEIDIMEYLGQQTDRVFGTLHFGQLFPNNQNISNGYILCEGGFNDDFHEFAIEWDVDIIRWYVDDILYGTLTPADLAPQAWPFNRDFHLILNMAVGGNLPGPPNASTVFPQTMEVDYVRVYQGQFASLAGNNSVGFQAQGQTYTVANAVAGASYNWSVPSGASIISGQGTSSIVVDWGDSSSAGLVTVSIDDGCNVDELSMNVCVAEETVSVLDCVLENFDDEALIVFKESIGTLEEIVNPDPSGINTSGMSGKYTRDPSQQFDNLQYSTTAIPDASQFVNGTRTFVLDMWTAAPVGTTIILQLESDALSQPVNFPIGRHSRYQAVTTIQNGWETLTFQFIDRPDSGVPDTDVDNIVFLFNPNSFTDDIYLFDNFEKFCTDTAEECLPPVPVVEVIPTMGEWGLACLMILLMIFGLVGIRQEEPYIGIFEINKVDKQRRNAYK